MFRMWGKIFADTKLIRDTTATKSDYSKSRTDMVFSALTDICHTLDLAEPIWLDSNISDFKYHARTRFTSDNFIESIPFDYLEIEVIEE